MCLPDSETDAVLTRPAIHLQPARLKGMPRRLLLTVLDFNLSVGERVLRVVSRRVVSSYCT